MNKLIVVWWRIHEKNITKQFSNGLKTNERKNNRHNVHFLIWAANFRKTSQRFREPLTLNEQETSEWVIWNNHVDSCHWFIGYALNTRYKKNWVHNSREFALSSVQSNATDSFWACICAIDVSQKEHHVYLCAFFFLFFSFHFDFMVLILDHKLLVYLKMKRTARQSIVYTYKMALIPFLSPTVDQLTSGTVRAYLFVLYFAEIFIIIIIVVVFCRLKKISWRLIRHI